jgi:lipopolysaccharide transport protein LptA
VKFFCLSTFILLVSLNLRAQTNAPAAPTWIDSDSAVFDRDGHQATYRGHVHVRDPGMKLNCEWLIINLPQSGGRLNHIVAETNVVIDLLDEKGQTNHVTGDMAVYDYNVQGSVTNDTVTLTGNPQVKNSMGTQGGDKITWYRITGKFNFKNPKGILNQSFDTSTTKTNPPATKTNFPPKNQQP